MCWPSFLTFLTPRTPRTARTRTQRRAEEGGSSVKLMLSADEKRELLELGYSEEEATDMRLELALAVLKRQTRRPWGDRPMPDEWQDEAVLMARVSDKEKKREGQGSSTSTSPNFSLVVFGSVAFLVFLLFLLALVAGPNPETSSPSSLPSGSLPEYSLRS
ncbi:unnamed protein product [Effrenium voratum]|uniref:Uncharacterized protein n=1 Tax=Effrenium voratum TaxID=2562239 RepID=A0AA36JBK4_9DINO|nr:unnamed protein product [Effrenium voratum]CAJ1427102.1 unnamed protein product [Effrenium voratum]